MFDSLKSRKNRDQLRMLWRYGICSRNFLEQVKVTYIYIHESRSVKSYLKESGYTDINSYVDGWDWFELKHIKYRILVFETTIKKHQGCLSLTSFFFHV